jgi:hypothetical protein
MADPEGAVLLVRGALADGDQARAVALAKQIAIARGAALGDENGWCVRCPPTPVCLGSMRDR